MIFLISQNSSGENRNELTSDFPVEFSKIYFQENAVDLEIVKTEESRRMGLSGRISLPENSGMLFIFDRPDFYGIWMKDMNFPIDIIWLNENLEVVGLKKNVAPETFPEVFYPDNPAIYVLEINAGLAEKFGLESGYQVKFE